MLHLQDLAPVDPGEEEEMGVGRDQGSFAEVGRQVEAGGSGGNHLASMIAI
jgi:hypothetical protein